MERTSPHVKRSYDATLRRARSADTRQRILDVARELLVEVGYHATTIASVAARAGVNVDTVYALVGRKPVLLKELLEQAISGTDSEVVAEEREYVKAVIAETDPAQKLVIYATAVRRIQERMAPLFLALRDAAATDPDAQAVWHEISERRAENMRKLTHDLRQSGGLRADMSIEQAADVIWATNSSELYVLLTVERGWSSAQFETWLADAWRRLLLG
jgi:AcrR family transcriptional regulator